MSVVAFGDKDGRAVEANVANHHPLLKLAFMRLARHNVLTDLQHIFLSVDAALQSLDATHPLQ